MSAVAVGVSVDDGGKRDGESVPFDRVQESGREAGANGEGAVAVYPVKPGGGAQRVDSG